MKIFFKKQAGFSLIEFLMIVAMITIIAGISSLIFKNIQPGLELKGLTRELITDLRYTQQMAVTQQVDHGIQFLLSERRYQVIKYQPTPEILKEKTLPDEIEFLQITGFTADKVKFNAYGAASEAGEIIIIATKNGATTTIEVSPSGFVKSK